MKQLINFILSLFSKKSTKKVDKKLLESYEKENTKFQKVIEEKEYIEISFKKESERLKSEFVELERRNPYLHKLLHSINDFTNEKFGKNILVTMIDRTQEEQDYLYRNSERYKKRKFMSPHQLWHAADLRSFTFTEDELKQIVEFINSNNDDANYYKWTAKVHTVGHGMHFHIQFTRK